MAMASTTPRPWLRPTSASLWGPPVRMWPLKRPNIALMTDDLLKIPEAIRLSKATLNNIRQNVVIALATVAFLLVGVMLGQVHMAEGMLIHEASVMIVILNGMRLLRT
ncbi:MAG: hypothetical protein M5U34_06120 [Chloroflexi bacterium]|nr:hypothetical protein [Chloroflexota bacterium]